MVIGACSSCLRPEGDGPLLYHGRVCMPKLMMQGTESMWEEGVLFW